MVRRPPLLSALGCLLLLCCGVSGQVCHTADSVRTLYRTYLNREPTADELTQWVWSFQKGLSSTEAQVTFMSSEEFFNRYSRNPSFFITGVFTNVLHRSPTAVELQRWLDSYNFSSGNRGKLVRDFLSVSQGMGAAAPPSVCQGVDEREAQLLATANLVHGALDDELGGTVQGRQLSVLARNLINSSRSLELAKPRGSTTYKQAFVDVGIALAAMEQEMRQLHIPAQTSSVYLARYRQIFSTMGGSTGLTPLPTPPLPTQPLPTPPLPVQPVVETVSSVTYNEYLQLSTVLINATTQVIASLRTSATLDANSTQLLRDIEFFQSQATSSRQSTRIGMLMRDLRQEFLRLRALAQGITNGMQRTGQVGLVAQQWQSVIQDMMRIGQLVGITCDTPINPGLPVSINRPTYCQLPYPVQPPTTAQLAGQAIPHTDRAIANIDAFVMGFNRFLALSPLVPSLQAQARSLRVLLVQFRVELGTVGMTTPQLNARLMQINISLQTLSTMWTQTVQQRQLVNAPDLSGISTAIANINQIFRGT